MTTIYQVCVSPVGWNEPQAVILSRKIEGGRDHRTLAAAVRAEHAEDRRCKRVHGPQARVPMQIIAVEGGVRRPLNPVEDEIAFAELTACSS